MFRCTLNKNELILSNTEQLAQLARLVQVNVENQMDLRLTDDDTEARIVDVTFA